jgi:hypothetical protein
MRGIRVSAILPVLIAIGMTAVPRTSDAQTARSGGGGAASAQLMQEMQQLASERTALQAENARLKKDVDDAHKERDQLKKAQRGIELRAKNSDAAVARDATQRESSERELTQTKAKMQELIAKFRETLQTLRETETASTTATQNLAARDRELKTCIDRNVALYHVNEEVLTRLEHHGVWSRMAEAEPFTKIKRVENENLVDGYKARADDQRVKPTSQSIVTPPPASAPAAPSSAAPAGAPTTPPAPPTPGVSTPPGASTPPR